MESDRTIETRRIAWRTVLASAAGVWLAYYALITLRSMILDADYLLEMFVRRGLVTLAGIAVTVIAWLFIRQADERRLALRVITAAIVMVPAAILLAAVNQRAFDSLERKMLVSSMSHEVQVRHDLSGNVLIDIPDAPDVPQQQLDTIQQKLRSEGLWKQLTDVAIGRYFLLIAWAALYFSLGYAETARAAERREGEYRRAAKAAELRSLRYQVNPHFLFNTLNSLSALVMTGKAAPAERMIQSLSAFYRRSLSAEPSADHSLADEVALQQAYLEIEGVRFPARLRTRFDIPPALAQAQVPGMLLQPLVENSVKYAVAASHVPVTISVSAHEEAGDLVLTVADNGAAAAVVANGHGIGLANVRDRLAARFGSQASLASGPMPEGGYRTVIRLPIVHHD